MAHFPNDSASLKSGLKKLCESSHRWRNKITQSFSFSEKLTQGGFIRLIEDLE
jgi:hypothetical protein